MPIEQATNKNLGQNHPKPIKPFIRPNQNMTEKHNLSNSSIERSLRNIQEVQNLPEKESLENRLKRLKTNWTETELNWLENKVPTNLQPWLELQMDNLNNFLSGLDQIDSVTSSIKNIQEDYAKNGLAGMGAGKLFGNAGKLALSGAQILKNKITGGGGTKTSFDRYKQILSKVRDSKKGISFNEFITLRQQLLNSTLNEIKDPQKREKLESFMVEDETNIALMAKRVALEGNSSDTKISAGIKANIASANKEMLRTNMVLGAATVGATALFGPVGSALAISVRTKFRLGQNFERDVNYNLAKNQEEILKKVSQDFVNVLYSPDFASVFTDLNDGQEILQSDYDTLYSTLLEANAIDGLSNEIQEQTVDYLITLRKAKKEGKITNSQNNQTNALKERVTKVRGLVNVIKESAKEVKIATNRKVAEAQARSGGVVEIKDSNGNILETKKVEGAKKVAFGKEIMGQRSFRFLQAALAAAGLGFAANKIMHTDDILQGPLLKALGNTVQKADYQHFNGAMRSFLVEHDIVESGKVNKFNIRGIEGAIVSPHDTDGLNEMVQKGYVVDVDHSNEARTVLIKAGQRLESQINPDQFITSGIKVQFDPEKMTATRDGLLKMKIPQDQLSKNYVEMNLGGQSRVFGSGHSNEVISINGEKYYLVGKNNGEVVFAKSGANVPEQMDELWANTPKPPGPQELELPDYLEGITKKYAEDGLIKPEENSKIIAELNKKLDELVSQQKTYNSIEQKKVTGLIKTLQKFKNQNLLIEDKRLYISTNNNPINFRFSAKAYQGFNGLNNQISDGKINKAEAIEILNILKAEQNSWRFENKTFPLELLKKQLQELKPNEYILLSNKPDSFSINGSAKFELNGDIYIQKVKQVDINGNDIGVNIPSKTPIGIQPAQAATAQTPQGTNAIQAPKPVAANPANAVAQVTTPTGATPQSTEVDMAGASDNGRNSGWGGFKRIDDARKEVGANAPQSKVMSKFLQLQIEAGSGNKLKLSDERASKILDVMIAEYKKTDSTITKEKFSQLFNQGQIKRSKEMGDAIEAELNKIFPGKNGKGLVFNRMTADAIRQGENDWAGRKITEPQYTTYVNETRTNLGYNTPENQANGVIPSTEEDKFAPPSDQSIQSLGNFPGMKSVGEMAEAMKKFANEYPIVAIPIGTAVLIYARQIPGLFAKDFNQRKMFNPGEAKISYGIRRAIDAVGVVGLAVAAGWPAGFAFAFATAYDAWLKQGNIQNKFLVLPKIGEPSKYKNANDATNEMMKASEDIKNLSKDATIESFVNNIKALHGKSQAVLGIEENNTEAILQAEMADKLFIDIITNAKGIHNDPKILELIEYYNNDRIGKIKNKKLEEKVKESISKFEKKIAEGIRTEILSHTGEPVLKDLSDGNLLIPDQVRAINDALGKAEIKKPEYKEFVNKVIARLAAEELESTFKASGESLPNPEVLNDPLERLNSALNTIPESDGKKLYADYVKDFDERIKLILGVSDTLTEWDNIEHKTPSAAAFRTSIMALLAGEVPITIKETGPIEFKENQILYNKKTGIEYFIEKIEGDNITLKQRGTENILQGSKADLLETIEGELYQLIEIDPKEGKVYEHINKESGTIEGQLKITKVETIDNKTMVTYDYYKDGINLGPTNRSITELDAWLKNGSMQLKTDPDSSPDDIVEEESSTETLKLDIGDIYQMKFNDTLVPMEIVKIYEGTGSVGYKMLTDTEGKTHTLTREQFENLVKGGSFEFVKKGEAPKAKEEPIEAKFEIDAIWTRKGDNGKIKVIGVRGDGISQIIDYEAIDNSHIRGSLQKDDLEKNYIYDNSENNVSEIEYSKYIKLDPALEAKPEVIALKDQLIKNLVKAETKVGGKNFVQFLTESKDDYLVQKWLNPAIPYIYFFSAAIKNIISGTAALESLVRASEKFDTLQPFDEFKKDFIETKMGEIEANIKSDIKNTLEAENLFDGAKYTLEGSTGINKDIAESKYYNSIPEAERESFIKNIGLAKFGARLIANLPSSDDKKLDYNYYFLLEQLKMTKHEGIIKQANDELHKKGLQLISDKQSSDICNSGRIFSDPNILSTGNFTDKGGKSLELNDDKIAALFDVFGKMIGKEVYKYTRIADFLPEPTTSKSEVSEPEYKVGQPLIHADMGEYTIKEVGTSWITLQKSNDEEIMYTKKKFDEEIKDGTLKFRT